MSKKKGAKAVKAGAKRRVGRKRIPKKKLDAAQLREELAGIVKSGAKEITKKIMSKAKDGELAPAKFLLEMAGVFPLVNDGQQATEEEDCLAKTLLDRLNLLKKPKQGESDDPGEVKGAEAPTQLLATEGTEEH